MLGEKDVSLFGRLKDMANSSFIEFKTYLQEKLEYIKDKIEPIKAKLLGRANELPEGKTIGE